MLNGTLTQHAPQFAPAQHTNWQTMAFYDTGRYIAGLLFTLGLIFGLWYLLRRYAPGLVRSAPASTGKTLFIRESLALDPRRRVIVVRDGGREHVLLLGLTGDIHIESRDAPAEDARSGVQERGS